MKAWGTYLIALIAAGCGATTRDGPRQASEPRVYRESFDDLARTQTAWLMVTPSPAGASVKFADGSARLVGAEGKGELVLQHRFDATALRGKRIRLTARAKIDAGSAVARANLAIMTPRGAPSYDDLAATRSISSRTWVDLDAVIDVDATAGTGDLSLSLTGPGTASFDDVELAVIDTPAQPSIQLTSQQLINLAVFARAAALIRYLHPSDQAATLDWDGFLPGATRQVLQAADTPALLSTLRTTFEGIAPTIAFYRTTAPPPPTTLPRGNATHLARWHHAGLGNDAHYVSHRDGRDPDTTLSGSQSLRVKLDARTSCKRAQLRASVHKRGDGEVAMSLSIDLPGDDTEDHERAVTRATREVAFEVTLPITAVDLHVGIEIKGTAGLAVESLSLACDDTSPVPIALDGEWQSWSSSDLFRWTLTTCGNARCGVFERTPLETELDAQRDVMTIDLGNDLHMRMPVAVWADARQTYPAAQAPSVHRSLAIRDLPVRLAAVISAWGTLSLFYPYFRDQNIEWSAALKPALVAASSARSSADLHEKLAHMVARLQDGHARVTHPGAPIDGVLPIALRRFEDKLVIVGSLPAYATFHPGAELVSVDGVPAAAAYERMRARISAGTAGWHDYAAGWYLTMGRSGAFRRLRVRATSGTESEHLLPLVDRELHDAAIRDPRPATGTELAPGVYYVDLEGLKRTTWQDLVPTLQRARGVVLDLRGYVTSTAYQALGQVTDREVWSPLWQTPLVGSTGSRYVSQRWSIRPAKAPITAPVVVLIDGRAASAAETVAQIIRDHKLAMFVGEPTGGTNGNVILFSLPGDFTVRFTGLRADGPGGVTIHGRGIAPDRVVHPTLDGVLAGRDEILEAGIQAVQELARRAP